MVLLLLYFSNKFIEFSFRSYTFMLNSILVAHFLSVFCEFLLQCVWFVCDCGFSLLVVFNMLHKNVWHNRKFLSEFVFKIYLSCFAFALFRPTYILI